MDNIITLDLPYDLIQSVRLAHALMETDYDVRILPEHEQKFAALKERFGVKFAVGAVDDVCVLTPSISHQEPSTGIGEIARPLIFPHSILEYCRTLWRAERPIRFSFAGLVTESRKAILQEWIQRSFPDVRVDLTTRESLPERLKSQILRRLRLPQTNRGVKRQFADVVFWSSRRGRTFPGKAWDDEYYRLLAQSQFVLCPAGDYVWSYRFFEAVMCGAIPVVEASCPAYEGFRYRTMQETAGDMLWSRHDADHNYILCRDRLTVQKEELNREITRLLHGESD